MPSWSPLHDNLLDIYVIDQFLFLIVLVDIVQFLSSNVLLVVFNFMYGSFSYVDSVCIRSLPRAVGFFPLSRSD